MKNRLELTWVGKEKRPRLEPRILLESPERSYHAKHRVTDEDIFDNRLIFGDNLLALKALEQEFTGKIKCIYIDPPYNTGSAFEHYDDGVEHSIWLSLMRDRIEVLRRLLSETGVLFAQVDDNEAQYLKVMMDEVFGRANFLTSFIWQKVDSPNDNKVPVTPDHEYGRGRCSATSTGCCTRCRRCARTWAAWSASTTRKRPGTVPATARASARTGRS